MRCKQRCRAEKHCKQSVDSLQAGRSRVEMYCKQSSGGKLCKATPPSSTFHLTALAAGNNMPWSACNLRCDTFWYSLHLGLTILCTMIFILDISMIFYSFWTFDTLFCASTDGAIYIAYIFTLNISSNAGHYVMWMRASSTTRTSMCPLMTRYTTFLHWTSSHITTRLYDIQRHAINMLCIESVLKQR